MNLHWGRTLEHKWVVHIKRHSHNASAGYNNTSERRYRYNSNRHRYYWQDAYLRNGNKTGANHSALYADSNPFKKSRMLQDILDHPVKQHSFTTVIVITGIFLFFTLTITAAVIIFCKKKNTVFTFQKSEQETEGEYEMDELNTDIEYTETDVESEGETSSHCKSFVHLSPSHADSPSHVPLVRNTRELAENSGPSHRQHHQQQQQQHLCQCHCDHRGAYQQIVVTAIMEPEQAAAAAAAAAGDGSDSDDSGTDHLPTSKLTILKPRYSVLSPVNFTEKDDYQKSFKDKEAREEESPPEVTSYYQDDPPSYDSLDYLCSNNNNNAYQLVVSVEKHAPPEVTLSSLSEIPSGRPHGKPSSTEVKTVHSEKASPPRVLYVNLPSQCSSVEKLPGCGCAAADRIHPCLSPGVQSRAGLPRGAGGQSCRKGFHDDSRDALCNATVDTDDSVVQLTPSMSGAFPEHRSLEHWMDTAHGPKRSMSVHDNLSQPSSIPADYGAAAASVSAGQHRQPQSCPQSPMSEAPHANNEVVLNLPHDFGHYNYPPHHRTQKYPHQNTGAASTATSSQLARAGSSVFSSVTSLQREQQPQVGLVLTSPMLDSSQWSIANMSRRFWNNAASPSSDSTPTPQSPASPDLHIPQANASSADTLDATSSGLHAVTNACNDSHSLLHLAQSNNGNNNNSNGNWESGSELDSPQEAIDNFSRTQSDTCFSCPAQDIVNHNDP